MDLKTSTFLNNNPYLIILTISSDFAGLAGLSISTIGTVALASEVGKAVRSFGQQERRQYRKAYSRKSRRY